MGFNIGLSTITSSVLLVTAIFLVITGILLTSASDKLTQIPEYGQSAKLQEKQTQLKTAYIITYISAGIIILLTVIYGGQGIYWNPTEWIHMFFFLIAFILLVVALIYAYSALVCIYDPAIPDTNGSTSFLWAALLIGLWSMMMIISVVAGRVGYNMIRGRISSQWSALKEKLQESGYDIVDRLEYVADNISNPNFDAGKEINEITSSVRQALNSRVSGSNPVRPSNNYDMSY